MKINPEEITSVLKKEIERYESVLQVEEEGTILEIGDGIARIYGLSSALAGEMLEFSNGSYGLAFNLEESSIGAVVLGEYEDLHEGDKVIVDKKAKPQVGSIVVAVVDGEYTVKHLDRTKSGQMVLQPANPNYEPIVPQNEMCVFGTVVGVVRKM